MLSSIYNYLFSKKDTRFYYLSLIKETNNTFSIHGLWPQNSKTDYPTFCKKVKFSIKELEPIIDELNKFWYSKFSKNTEFWKHEYMKHGSCMFCSMTEYEYFDKTLYLYNKVIAQDLTNYYPVKDNKCLIPVDLNFNFIRL